MPQRLKSISNALSAKLVHISTDCVFSGRRGSYTEYDIKDAEDTYVSDGFFLKENNS